MNSAFTYEHVNLHMCKHVHIMWTELDLKEEYQSDMKILIILNQMLSSTAFNLKTGWIKLGLFGRKHYS